MISYYYNDTDNIKKLLIEIEANKIVFDNISIPIQIKENISRQSLLQSSVYSARIEGNPLTIDQIKDINHDTKNFNRLEIFNLLKAYKNLRLLTEEINFNLDLVKNFHHQVMDNISYLAGKFRREPWAIYNSAGFVVYLAPPSSKVPRLMEEYIDYINHLKFHPCINAAIAQFIFEKIHPFADGNGRVGRLLSVLLLKKNNFNFQDLLTYEEYIDNHRDNYYASLEPEKDMTEFVEFFLYSILESVKSVLNKINGKIGESSQKANLLPPRRQEILNIIIDHPFCSFDFLSRRFSAVNIKTLHYDLKKLIDLKLVDKIGVSRGAVYQKSDTIKL